MIRIDFEKPKTALEIREPTVLACKQAASELGLFVTFCQSQQQAFDGHARQRNRTRIGNGKHKNWAIGFQTDEPRIRDPNIVGRLILKTDVVPENMQFGGFDYGKYGETPPVYRVLKVYTPSELSFWRPLDPEPALCLAANLAICNTFDTGKGALFDVTKFGIV